MTEEIKLNILDKILDSVKKYISSDLKYIKIKNETVGLEQGSTTIEFYDPNYNRIELDVDFDKKEELEFRECCLEDYICNSLVGYNFNGVLQDSDYSEFFSKTKPDSEYYYVVK